MVLTGLTARWEMYPFYDGVAAAGGWNYFDAVGLHIFHDGPPTEDSYNNGILSQEVKKVINAINNNGGGKPIWVTEFGFDSNLYGLENQSNWMIEGLNIVSGFGEVQKILIYRLYDRDTAHGLITAGFANKPVYDAVKAWMAGSSAPAPVAAAVAEPALAPVEETSTDEGEEGIVPTSSAPSAPANKEKSLIRLDGQNIAADGKAQYRIVVQAKDAEGKILTNQKPSLILSGGQTTVTDFVLVGEEWFAYVSSAKDGEKTAQIKIGGIELGSIKMVFGASSAQTETPEATAAAGFNQTRSNSYLFWFIGGAILINLLIVAFLLLFRKRHKLMFAS